MQKVVIMSGNSGGFILSCPGDPSLQIPEKLPLVNLVCPISHFWPNLTALLVILFCPLLDLFRTEFPAFRSYCISIEKQTSSHFCFHNCISQFNFNILFATLVCYTGNSFVHKVLSIDHVDI